MDKRYQLQFIVFRPQISSDRRRQHDGCLEDHFMLHDQCDNQMKGWMEACV